MSLNTTTLTSACLITDSSIVVAAATGIAAGYLGRLDDETVRVATSYVAGSLTVPLVRGQQGTLVAAHPVTTNFTVGAGSDAEWGTTGASSIVPNPLAGRTRRLASYTAAGAIAHPDPGTDQVAVLNGTNAIAMTLAVPSKALDGCILIIVGNGKAAHTITVAGGIGLASTGYTVATFITGAQQSLALIACNAAWVQLPSLMSGTLTNILVALA